MKSQVAVIGSGPGGAIAAFYLAQAGLDVALIEEGGEEVTPAFSLKELRSKYRGKGQTVAFGSPPIQYVEGCTVGGGSEINSGLYHRLPDSIRKEWEKRLQIDSFSSSHLEPHYRECERILSVQTSPSSVGLASLKMVEGSARLNWKVVEVPRWYSQEGIRHSMSHTFISEFIRCSGRLFSHTKVARLIRAKEGWKIKTSKGDFTAKTVFLSAGTIQTPWLLKRSGIQKNIGKELALHPTVKLTARFPEEINGENGGVPVHQVKEFSPSISLGGSISRLPHLMAAHAHLPEFPEWFLKHWKHLFTYYAMISSSTRGKVHSIPGCSAPFVTYQMSEEDKILLGEGQKKLAALLFAAGAEEVISPSGGRFTDPSRLPGIDKKTKGVMTIHLVGSCPMGENRLLSACDSFGKVHEVENLYISDGSLLGGSPSVNPQGIIMALARRNVIHFLSKRGLWKHSS